MVDHRVNWVRLREVVQQRFPNDDLVAEIAVRELEIAVRELFNAEETVVYAADLDAQVDEQGVSGTSFATSCGKNSDDDEYVHVADTDDLAYFELPIDEEAAKATAEQRALMASFGRSTVTSLPAVS
jgi:hypothetical protein